jgi:alanine racemase
MTTGTLTIDLNAVVANWRALDAMSVAETAAVVKADAYGLGVAEVSRALARAGVRQFFVAVAQEGVAVRKALGPGPTVSVFSGHMDGDTALIRDFSLTPMINSIDQLVRHAEAMPDAPFGIQLDTGMNRLGMEIEEWGVVQDVALPLGPKLIMSHLSCADTPDHPMNAQQLGTFRRMTQGIDIPLSLAATGGILLGETYHFDVTRAGVGLFGGLPFVEAQPVVTLDLPIIQIRDLAIGENVGYGNIWTATRLTRIATVAAGYADGLFRIIGPSAHLFADGQACPIAGRVSMDLICADITDIPGTPDHMQILGPQQSIDTLANAAKTIGYEVLTSLGNRYTRTYSQ